MKFLKDFLFKLLLSSSKNFYNFLPFKSGLFLITSFVPSKKYLFKPKKNKFNHNKPKSINN